MKGFNEKHQHAPSKKKDNGIRWRSVRKYSMINHHTVFLLASVSALTTRRPPPPSYSMCVRTITSCKKHRPICFFLSFLFLFLFLLLLSLIFAGLFFNCIVSIWLGVWAFEHLSRTVTVIVQIVCDRDFPRVVLVGWYDSSYWGQYVCTNRPNVLKVKNEGKSEPIIMSLELSFGSI